MTPMHTPLDSMDPTLVKFLNKQQYHIVGEHSSVKLCHWMRQKLLYNRPCYKERFYGIASHRCLQMTPTINQCTKSCLYCWRFQGFSETTLKRYDEPEFILDECLKSQKKLVSGFKGDERCNQIFWQESREPKHVAISLSGEPTLYPQLGEFIGLCKKRGLTTFLVTNGTNPKALENLETLPTQLYVSVDAPNKKIYEKLCFPQIPKAWELLKKTLTLLPSLETRTVIRHTLVDGWNIGNEKDYAKLDKLADPMFIEPKAYVFVGYSRERMNLSNMPSHETVKKFGEKIGDILGYKLVAEEKGSRVVLLTRDEKTEKSRKIIEKQHNTK